MKKKRPFCPADGMTKKTLCCFRAFWYNQFLVIWGLHPRTNSRQVS